MLVQDLHILTVMSLWRFPLEQLILILPIDFRFFSDVGLALVTEVRLLVIDSAFAKSGKIEFSINLMISFGFSFCAIMSRSFSRILISNEFNNDSSTFSISGSKYSKFSRYASIAISSAVE